MMGYLGNILRKSDPTLYQTSSCVFQRRMIILKRAVFHSAGEEDTKKKKH
jgi:hypothetical protein